MPQDPFAQYVVTQPKSDPFAAFVASPDQSIPFASKVADLPTPQPAHEPPRGVSGFVSGVLQSVNPLPAIKQFSQMTAEKWDRAKQAAAKGDYIGATLLALDSHPVTGIGHVAIGAGKAQWEQIVKARERFQQGRYSEGVGHALAGITPLMGPAAAAAGEAIGRGDVAHGLGQATGLAGAIVAPGAIARTRGVNVPSPFRNRNAAAVEAVEAGHAAGVPIDAATATGNRAVSAMQHMADRSLGGSLIAEKAAEAQSRGLATMGEQLAAKGYGTAITPEQAGAAAREGVRGATRARGAEADAAYTKLREIENAPQNAQTITPEIDTLHPAESGTSARPIGRFAKPGASTEELFQGVLGDARANGYAGTAEALRTEFLDKMASGKRAIQEQAAIEGDTGSRALLAEIRRRGGIKPWESDRASGGPTIKLREDFRDLQQRLELNYGMKGGGSIFRSDGLGLDDLADQLASDPKWRGTVPNDPEALKGLLRDIASKGPSAGGSRDVAAFLEPVGIKPGEKWWSEAASGAQTMQAPVDLRFVKQQLQPLYADLKRQSELVPLMGDKGRALVALDRLVGGPDYAPLSTVDAALGELKSFARADIPELRSAGQGAAAQAIKELEQAVGKAAENLGPEAVTALQQGRSATVAKYEAGGVLEGLSEHGARAFNALTARKDTAVGQLRDVAKHAAAELPKIGRAFLDDLLETATKDGGFEHGAVIANRWQSLGTQTKILLYRDPKYVRELDQFFNLARMTAKNANPSGTAHAFQAGQTMAAISGGVSGVIEPVTAIGILVGPAAVSKFMHSSAGVRLLSKGFRVPLGSKAARTAWAAEVTAFAKDRGFVAAPTAAESQAEQPPDIGRR